MSLPDVVPLLTVTRDYAWGSTSAIPSLCEEAGGGGPVAELWVGAHPDGPSRWADHPNQIGLDALVAADPAALLGAPVATAYGNRLPFLLKVLAAERALSLQVHPSRDQAVAGYRREEAAGIPHHAPTRDYHDDNHKPELLCALTPFDALCNFRDPETTMELIDELAVTELSPLRSLLVAAGDLRRSVTYLLALDAAAAGSLARQVAAAAARVTSGRWVAEARWLATLGEQYPGDIGVVVGVLLNLVRLQPGEAVYLADGQMHAYLRGVGVEILANSDNVLRGGLTAKHVNVPELLAITDFRPTPAAIVGPLDTASGERVYPVPVPDFQLSSVQPRGGVRLTSPGPTLLLVTAGWVELRGDGSPVVLGPGRAAFVPAGRSVLAVGAGTLFRAVAA